MNEGKTSGVSVHFTRASPFCIRTIRSFHLIMLFTLLFFSLRPSRHLKIKIKLSHCTKLDLSFFFVGNVFLFSCDFFNTDFSFTTSFLIGLKSFLFNAEHEEWAMLFCLLIRSITFAQRHLDCHLDYRRFHRYSLHRALAAASLCYPTASDCSSPVNVNERKALNKLTLNKAKDA